MNNHDAIDDLITDVARRMTAAEPPVDLSARVLAQLRPRRATVRSWWLATAAVGAAAIALIAVREARRPESLAPSMAAVTTVAPTAASDPQDASNTALTESRTNTAPRRVTRRVSAPRVSDVDLAWHARALPGLAPADAIAITPIQPSAIAIPLLEVAPIAAEPLRGPAGNVNRER